MLWTDLEEIFCARLVIQNLKEMLTARRAFLLPAGFACQLISFSNAKHLR